MIRNDHAGGEGLKGDKEAKRTSRGLDGVRLTQIYCLDYRPGHGMFFFFIYIVEETLDKCYILLKCTFKIHKGNT